MKTVVIVNQPTQQHKDYTGDHRGPKDREERSDRDNHNVTPKVRMSKARRKDNKGRVK